MGMKEILISEFKAKCIKLLKDVKRTNAPLTITLRGKPLAIVYPAETAAKKIPRLGTLRGTVEILEDIDSINTEKDWEMLKD